MDECEAGALRALICVCARWAVVCALSLVCVLWLDAAGAGAFSQRGHTFAFAFGGAGGGEGQLGRPSGVAVDQATGEVFVADYANDRVDVFEPVVSAGAVVGARFVRSFAVPAPSAVAVDGSSGSSDPSRGDVYVVGSTEHELKEEEPNKRIFKFTPEGKQVAVLRRFKEPVGEGEEPEEAEEFEAIQGIAVAASGELYVYGSGSVDVFDNAAKRNRSVLSIPAPAAATRGVALNSEGDIYIGHSSENPAMDGPEGAAPVVGEVEGITGQPLVGELEPRVAEGVAVNTEDVPGNGVDELDDVYVAEPGVGSRAGSSVAEFSPQGALIQRFGAPGLEEPTGVAVDDATGTVFVTDGASDEVDVFGLEAPGSPSVDRLTARLAGTGTGETSTVRVEGEIDPDGLDTHYYLEYGPVSCGSSGFACSRGAEADLGGGFGARPVSVEVSGLAPGEYHYRLVASNADGSAGREQVFPVLARVSGLPDGRAWEMVSPPQKGGAAVEPLRREGGFVMAAEAGGAFTYVAKGAIAQEAEGNRSFEPQQVLAVRGGEGWSTQDIATPNGTPAGANFGPPEYQDFSPDLSVALVEPFAAQPPLAEGVAGKMVYLRDDPPLAPEAAQQEAYGQAQAGERFLQPGFLALVSALSAPEAPPSASAVFLGASPDLRHVVIESPDKLAGASSARGLYEWSPGGRLQFVSVLPGGQAASSFALGYLNTRARAVSGDGSRVFWTASQSTSGHLYMRDLAIGETLQLDEAQEGAGEPEGEARFQSASSDGSRVFFTDSENLLPGATGEPQRGVSDLYVCEIQRSGGKDACLLRDLTVPLRADERAAVQGSLLGVSEDGSSVYLVAQGVLAENENAGGEAAEPGHENLYELHHSGSGWAARFIAQLSGEDAPDWDQGTNASVAEDSAFQTARVSPNGRYLAFMSQRSPTGYDNEDASSEHPGERIDEEVFLYDSQDGTLTCASCDPTGARPTGVLDEEKGGEGIGLLADRRESWRGQWLAGNIPGWTSESLTSALIQSRYLSNEGRLFFNSADPLVPGISSPTREEQVAGEPAQVGVENVYEYEPAGVGGCGESSGGCVALLSGGSSSRESAFMEATASGSEAFFITAAQLLPQDTDEAFDVYDARECTASSPCLPTPPPAAQPCETTGECRPASGPTHPTGQPAGTASVLGPGNPTPQPNAHASQGVKGTHAASKPATRAQKLAKALALCRRRHAHSAKKRRACEANARRQYGTRLAHTSEHAGRGRR